MRSRRSRWSAGTGGALEAIATGDVSINGESDAINRRIRMLGLN
ncbi:hypothetical protein ACWDKQ_33870 [Saccharopolyspora sp. NPDC000995]